MSVTLEKASNLNMFTLMIRMAFDYSLEADESDWTDEDEEPRILAAAAASSTPAPIGLRVVVVADEPEENSVSATVQAEAVEAAETKAEDVDGGSRTDSASDGEDETDPDEDDDEDVEDDDEDEDEDEDEDDDIEEVLKPLNILVPHDMALVEVVSYLDQHREQVCQAFDLDYTCLIEFEIVECVKSDVATTAMVAK